MAAQVFPPASAYLPGAEHDGLVCLELEDGVAYQGYSFGAPASVAGELVFQTGMVGYPESITDPSYRGQILVITFPLVGNYGRAVARRPGPPPGRPAGPLRVVAHPHRRPGHGLVLGRDYSHFQAGSSLGTWLKEQGIPAMYGVDTRALTKRIRQEGSMLGRMLHQKQTLASSNGTVNGQAGRSLSRLVTGLQPCLDTVDWVNPNEKNLVAEGEFH